MGSSPEPEAESAATPSFYFAQEGWNVAASLRTKHDELSNRSNY